ncbi:TonB-dependent receptor [Sphingomonas flavalba]|uniref:TonB-dependent receptor n=1 Tax=Sphingomonas flavalba TaxID=2559804 RepID=UPI001446F07B|nr:TonB-dependent receptor [Sphingomonas flavalba]
MNRILNGSFQKLHRARYGVSPVALAAAAFGLAPAAHAQDAAQPGDQQDIVVTGIRASIDQALQSKRSADSIIDSISSESIGKFPDSNVAESLQRIPGVSIDRQGGEGRFVSINGLGPEFSSVLVNGRPIASDNPDRSFSFDTIASELVSTVNVYKSANARIPEGGVGGTIDVITARPFDYSGFTFAGSASAQYEGNSKKTSPQLSFIASDRFADGKLGILLSFTHQERRNRTYLVQNSATIHNLFYDTSAYAYVSDDLDEAWRMQDLQRSIVDEKRTRTGGSAVIQFEPSDKLLFTLDYLYSRFKVDTTVNAASNWFWAVQDTSRNVVDPHGVYTTFDHGVGMGLSGYAFILQKQQRPTTTQQLGFNTKWTPDSRLTGVFDLSWSQAINNNRGRDRDYTLEALDQPGFLVVTPPGGVPYLDGQGFVVNEANESLLRARINSNSGTYVKATNWQARADFDYEFSSSFRAQFGGSYLNARKQNEFWQTPEAIRRMYHKNAQKQVIDYQSIITGIARPGNVFGNPLLNGDMYLIDGEALRAWMADPVNLANRTLNPGGGGLAEFIANGNSWAAVKSGDSYVIDEKDLSAYVDLHLDTDLLGSPLSLVGGLRYSHTSQSSEGTTRILVDLYTAPGETTGILTPLYSSNGLERIVAKNRYGYFMPSFNARWDLPSGFVLRLAASRTMTRPILEDLAPQITYGSMFKVARYAKGSNPYLRPFTSINIDGSVEWYYKKDSALSVAFFHKDIDNYIVSGVADEVIDTVATPAYQTFTITRPRNADTAWINGLTVAWTHIFDFGFGFQANYTKVSGKVKSSDPAVGSFALPGLSDTANLIAFFERGPFGARVAYNWRGKFLAQPNYGGTAPPQPRNYQTYHQIDARVSLALLKGTTLAVDVVNLTGEKVLSHATYDSQFISYADYGRQYKLTLSQRF